MEVITLASGSSGNCILISHGGAHLLVDCGISCRRVEAALAGLGLSARELSGVLITHEHTDHIAGLATLTKKYRLPVYTSPGTGMQLCYRIAAMEDVLRQAEPGTDFEAGPFGVSTFPTSHDAAEPMGFRVACAGRSAAVVTDLGVVTPAVERGVLGAGLVVCEANHDVDWLLRGPYPYHLKQRILGERGHLSNQAGAQLARQCVEAGARAVILAHLSAQNNTPAQALAAAREAFAAAGIRPGVDAELSVAPRSEASRRFLVP